MAPSALRRRNRLRAEPPLHRGLHSHAGKAWLYHMPLLSSGNGVVSAVAALRELRMHQWYLHLRGRSLDRLNRDFCPEGLTPTRKKKKNCRWPLSSRPQQLSGKQTQITSSSLTRFHHPPPKVMPMYSNTHTTSSACGLQSMQFTAEARYIVKNCVNATDKGGHLRVL